MERELLAIVEKLKEYCNIIQGQSIRVYTDHKNLTCSNFNTQRVIWWRMVIEDFGPEIVYIPGPANVVVDVIRRLDTTNNHENTQLNCDSNIEIHLTELAGIITGEPLPGDIHLLSIQLIQKE